MIPSREAIEINEALEFYRLAEGTEHEADALAALEATVARVKAGQVAACCGGLCRFCPTRGVP